MVDLLRHREIPYLHLSFVVFLALLSLLSTLHYIHLTTTQPLPPPLPFLPDLPHPRTTLHALRNASTASPSSLLPLKPTKVAPSPPPPTLHAPERPLSGGDSGDLRSPGKKKGDKGVFHDDRFFAEDYAEMNRSFKVFVYPHNKTDRFAHALLPADSDPGGNYASEGYFKKALMESTFVTTDPSEAHLFFLPFSIAALRNDKAVGVGGIPRYVRDYVSYVSEKYPYWNRSGGADHFYVACHSVGRSATDKAERVRSNAIQVVCSSSYFLAGYVPHKDASIPQIWPRKGPLPNVPPNKRMKLAFYAGAMNSPLRRALVDRWGNDSEIGVHSKRLSTPYADSLLASKFCLHVKGFEVNTARVADAIFHGCVPVILADHYDLPFADILDWTSFSVVLPSFDIPKLKDILLNKVISGEYEEMHRNVMRVRKHFRWNLPPRDRDVFYMVMYELWLRRSVVRFEV